MSVNILNASVESAIKSHAQDFPTEEVCGVVFDGKATKLANLANDKANHFEIDLSWLSLVPDAIYHSHWSEAQPGEFSLDDLEMCRDSVDQIPYILYHTAFDEWDYYDPESPNPFPLKLAGDWTTLDFYLNWRFVWGRSDCFELVRCYYQGMLGIDIGNFPRPPLDNFPTTDWLTPWKADKHGFVEVPTSSPVRKHDIIQMAMKGGREPNHIGVIADDTKMQLLHNVGSEYTSQVGLYGSYWQQRTTHIFRHESLC